MKTFIGFVSLLALLLVAAAPAAAQTEDVPAFSVKRLSLGLSAEYVMYRPASSVLGLRGDGEVKVALPVSYNLGRFSSLTAKVRVGLSSEIKEYSAGIVLHLLARGSKP